MDELKKLEKTGKYLFHGSMSNEVKELHPRQAMSFQKPDGEPAIFATEAIDPPIFMAVLGSRKLGGWGKKDLPGFGFYISEDDIKRAKKEDWKGFVYVLDRKSFQKQSGWEWRSKVVVKPLKIIKVGINDLPSQIEVIPHDDYMAISRGQG